MNEMVIGFRWNANKKNPAGLDQGVVNKMDFYSD
jgi:hypothetical protein